MELKIDADCVALAAWKRDGGIRPKRRPDGWPTRADLRWQSPAEKAIRAAMAAVEGAGASEALTDAVILLDRALQRVADHVEGNGGPKT